MGDRAGYLSFLCAKSEISYRTQQSGGAGGHKCDMEWRHKGGVGLEVTNCKSRECLVASVECVRNLHMSRLHYLKLGGSTRTWFYLTSTSRTTTHRHEKSTLCYIKNGRMTVLTALTDTRTYTQ